MEDRGNFFSKLPRVSPEKAERSEEEELRQGFSWVRVERLLARKAVCELEWGLMEPKD